MKNIITLALIFMGFIATISIANSQENEVIFENGKKISKAQMRIRHFEEMRSFPTKELSSEKRQNAFKEMESMTFRADKKAMMQAQQPEWRAIGPFSTGGRVKSIAIHPTESSTIYIGAASGGIWKTTNSGTSWTPIFDYEIGIGFGSICIDQNNPDIIYAATGEAVLNGAAYTYLSSGVFKSTNAGESWSSIGLTNVGAFSKFFVHPLNSNKLVGGVVGMNMGFYYSDDAGATWKQSADFAKNLSDVTYNPEDENEYYVGVIGEGVYYTSNSGETWVARNSGLPTGINRVSVQLAPSSPDILYCLLEAEGIGNIYKSTNKGANWTRSYRGAEEFFNGQGWYDNYIMVHPTNPNLVIAGGIDVWKTTNGGSGSSSWANITNGYAGGSVHVDQHCAAINPSIQNELWIGNDGGVYKSYNLGESFVEVNEGLEITQFYGMDIDQKQINRTFGGTQDNGTLSNHINADFWGSVNGGDGFRTVLDHGQSDILYGEVYTGGSIYPFKRNLVNGSYSVLSSGINAADVTNIWDPPLVIHPIHNFVLYHGRNNLYYSFENGNRWSIGIKGEAGTKFTAIGVSPLHEEMIYAGDNTGGLFVTKNHFESYQNTSLNGLVARTITDIECSAINVETAFVTVSGYGTSHAFKTTNAGQRWESIGDKLPDIPCLTIAIHPENEDWIFVGTDIGVFATFNAGGTWLPLGRKLPRTIITDMKILNNKLTGNYILRVSTHGRSMWEIDLPTDIINDIEITSPIGGEVLTGTSMANFSWYGFERPVKVEITYDDGKNWYVWADDLNSNYIPIKIPNKESHLNRIRVTSKVNPSQEKISNTFTITRVKKGSVLQTSSFSHVPYGIARDGEGNLWSTSFYTNQLFRINKTTLRAEDYVTLPGDSLFTDLTIDKTNQNIYVHRMNSSGDAGTGGIIIKSDMQGRELKRYDSPAKGYPIGLELVDQDLIVCDRDNPRYIFITEPATGKVWTKYDNPFKEYLGPRGLCYDGERYLYQASTHFSGSGGIVATYIVKIDKNDYTTEVDRIPLAGRNGVINCRGIEYDPDDKNFWITDFGGNIFKISGFETTVDVEEAPKVGDFNITVDLYPNPVSDLGTVYIKDTKSSVNLEIRITDLLGNVVLSLDHPQTDLTSGKYINFETESMNNGIYYLTIYENGNPIKSNKLVVVK